MLVLGIYGSPRKGGNTDLMLDAFLEGAASAGGQVQRVYARDLSIGGCLACGHCDRHGRCVQKDDMAGVYPLFEAAERIVLAAPIYFYGVPGQVKLLIDRSQASFMARDLARKRGEAAASQARGFLLSAGATRGKRLFECALLTARYFFDALGAEYAGELCFRELDARGAILERPDALAACRQAGAAFMEQG